MQERVYFLQAMPLFPPYLCLSFDKISNTVITGSSPRFFIPSMQLATFPSLSILSLPHLRNSILMWVLHLIGCLPSISFTLREARKNEAKKRTCVPSWAVFAHSIDVPQRQLHPLPFFSFPETASADVHGEPPYVSLPQ